MADRDACSPILQPFAAALAAHPGQSAFAVLHDGAEALLSRTALADQATRSIDAQYYIYEADHSGLALLERLAAAADRGVRVRLLVDDNNLAVSDVVAAQLASHPGLEVRVFNPFAGRVRWLRPFEGLLRLKRLNRRMHNKLFLVDGSVAVVGGRNVGDDYFGNRPGNGFADVDLLAIGPVGGQVQRAFDEYWHSRYAVDPREFLRRRPARRQVPRIVAELRARQPRPAPATPSTAACTAYLGRLARDSAALAWGSATLVHDAVDKVDALGRRRSAVGAALVAEWRQAQQEVLLASAYFVPRRLGLRLVRESIRRGVKVQILTNSLAATDVTLVHVGYARYRRRLFAAGARLFEFRRGPHAASLHAKLAVFDRQACWVGSFNFDPRSLLLNTEVGLLVQSAELARRLAVVFEQETSPVHSWELVRRPHTGANAPLAARRWSLGWRGEVDGRTTALATEPATAWWRHWVVRLAARIPGLDQVL